MTCMFLLIAARRRSVSLYTVCRLAAITKYLNSLCQLGVAHRFQFNSRLCAYHIAEIYNKPSYFVIIVLFVSQLDWEICNIKLCINLQLINSYNNMR